MGKKKKKPVRWISGMSEEAAEELAGGLVVVVVVVETCSCERVALTR